MKAPLLIIVGIAAILALMIYFLVAPHSASLSDGLQSSVFNNNQSKATPTNNDMNQLQITDEVIGQGEAVKTGDSVSVLYTGTLEDGTVFDSSEKHNNDPFSFTVGGGQVIAGWEQGLIGMKVGGTRKLVIPPQLGYGSRDLGSIPPNSTLIFEIQLISIN